MPTEVRLPRAALNDVDLPAVCVVTGVREGVERYDVTLYAKPPWMPMAFGTHSKVVGRLPFSHRGWTQWRIAEYGAAAASIVLGLASCGGVGAMLTLSPAWANVALIGGVFVVAALVSVPHVIAARFGPYARTADAQHVTLRVPSADAAAAIVARFDAPPSADGMCAAHPDVRATFTCPRCGSFGCEACARRLVGSDHPVCPACHAARTAAVASQESRRVTNAAVGAFVGALIGLVWFPAAMAALGYGAFLLSRWRTLPPAARIWALLAALFGMAGLARLAVWTALRPR